MLYKKKFPYTSTTYSETNNNIQLNLLLEINLYQISLL